MIKCNSDGQKSRHKKITPIIFLPSSSRVAYRTQRLPFRSLPTLRYPAGCSYTMPNGRPGTLIEISFLIEGTYLVVKTWEGHRNVGEEKSAGRRERALRLFSSSRFPSNVQSAFYLSCRLLFTHDISLACNYRYGCLSRRATSRNYQILYVCE